MPWAPLAALAVVAATLHLPPAHAQMYKWTDEKGVVHYTDKLPAEVVNKGNVELNKQGVPIKKTEPALTYEQRRARELEVERQAQLAREQELLDRRDRALLSTYTTESEIDLARNRSLNTIDEQVQSSASYTAALNKRKAEIEARQKAQGDKLMPPALERELVNVTAELQKQAQLVELKQKEAAVVNARYDADKQRWRELRMTAAKAAGELPPSVPTAGKK